LAVNAGHPKMIWRRRSSGQTVHTECGEISMNIRRSFVCALIALSCIIVLPAAASTFLDVGDDVYPLLSRLEAEGVITSGLLDTRPISRTEAVRLLREAEQQSKSRSPFVQSLVHELEQRLEGGGQGEGQRFLDTVYAKYIWTSAPVIPLSYPGAAVEKEQAFNENNAGDLYERGSNYRIGLTSRLEDVGNFSLYLNPELRGADGQQQGVLRTGYAVLGFSWIDIVAGKDSQWWGPGQHGALLLSNNAEPPEMIKLTAPVPQHLPWIFKYLGPFQYDVFVSRLEKDRSDFPEPYLWGLRFDFKPHPAIEIGLERTGMLGGTGRPTTLHTWADSIFGAHEHLLDPNQEVGDQIGGYDAKLTLPFEMQPLQLYWEQGGEDSRQRTGHLPYKKANLYGLYLPRLGSVERLSLRAEYATDYVRDQPYVWYTHGVYTAGYTHDGMVMGHHMGTDAQDAFVELSLLIPEHRANLSLSFDRERHGLAGPVCERTDELVVKGDTYLSDHLQVKASGGVGWVKNPGNLPAPSLYPKELTTELRYIF
jgi:hypothetical protein